MTEFKTNKITKKEFLKINENNLMFITNPGRMGDEDGSTFIIKDGNKFTIYRADGWMYQKPDEIEVSLKDALKQFPRWQDAWDHAKEDDYKGKYKYLYMGFGNGLSIDNSIYNEFVPYLNNRTEKYLERKSSGDKESLQYAAIFDVWENAFMDMVDDKSYVIKNKE